MAKCELLPVTEAEQLSSLTRLQKNLKGQQMFKKEWDNFVVLM